MRAIASGLLCAVLATPAAAAESALKPPDLERFLRWGPVRVRPGIALSNLGYDDNILFGSGETKVGDYTATFSPKVDGLVLFGHGPFLTFREQLDYTAYVDNSAQNFLNNRSVGRLTVPLRRLGVFTELKFNRLKERPVDLNDVRPERRERGATFGLILEPGWRTEIEIARSFEGFRYQDPDSSLAGLSIGERLDRSERATALRIAYRALGRTRILLRGLSQTIDFDRPFLLGGEAIPRDTRETRLQAGLELTEGGPLTGSFLLGWDRIDAQDPQLADLSALIGEAELAYRLNSRTRLELEGKRLPGFAIAGANSYFLNTNVSLRAVYYLNRLIGVELGSGQGTLGFPDSEAASPRRDRLSRYDLGVRFRLFENSMGRRTEYRIRVGRFRRDSNLDTLDRSQTTIGLDAVLGF